MSTRSFTLKVFKSGNSAALRLPKDLGFLPGEEVHACHDGEALVLRHADPQGWPEGYFESWEPIAAGFEAPGRGAPGTREGRLKRLFGGRGSAG